MISFNVTSSFWLSFLSLSLLSLTSTAFLVSPRRTTTISVLKRTQQQQQQQQRLLLLSATATTTTTTLPTLFPELAPSLTALGFVTPTPIQSASATRALGGEHCLLIAPTGSGKTLAYLLPALTHALGNDGGDDGDGTILVVAPTRELAIQLGRDAIALLAHLGCGTEEAEAAVCFGMAGIPLPTAQELGKATLLIGTPIELLYVLSNTQGGGNFVAGETLCAVVLDEVDVLLPLPPKQLRTSLDERGTDKNKNNKKKSTFDTAQDERRKLEQRRKLMTAKRQGAETTKQHSNKQQLIAPTEKLLNFVASHRFVGGVNAKPPQILAGSATASRRTLDRLNSALRSAAESGGAGTMESIWSTQVKTVRPEEEVEDAITTTDAAADADDDDDSSSEDDVANKDDEQKQQQQQQQHTIRAVTVPQEVMHRYILLTKDEALSSDAVLTAVAKAAAGILKPQQQQKTALLFLCGEFAKKTNMMKAKATPSVKAAIPSNSKTSKARRELTKRREAVVATKRTTSAATTTLDTTTMEPLSARRACSTLQQLGIVAQPLHVALGLEKNAKEDNVVLGNDGDDGVVTTAPRFLVTFEGSARGLHLDDIDVVFVVGRPASAASYLHLAGRVGRSSPSIDGGVEIRPGTVVSLCTKGSATELDKWTRQIGGTELKELIL